MKKFMLLLLVCAAPALAQDQSAELRAAAGCGPAATEFSVKVDKNQHAVSQPEPGKALVYVPKSSRLVPNFPNGFSG